jgi:hypothetical protein
MASAAEGKVKRTRKRGSEQAVLNYLWNPSLNMSQNIEDRARKGRDHLFPYCCRKGASGAVTVAGAGSGATPCRAQQ